MEINPKSIGSTTFFVRSKEDLTQKISKSIFVTNFPDHISARDLWETCKAYGTVVDVHIPYKKFKAGKRFAFVRFINVENLDRLVANLCTIWIGSYHLQANIVRYQRERKTYDSQNSFKWNVGISSDSFKGNVGNYSNSFASVLKSGKPVTEATGWEVPSLVLDDTCFSDRDFNLSLMEKVKDISALPNLYVILEEEGFQNFKISYLGGMWVLIELESSIASQKFIKHARVGSWFSSLQPTSNSFVSDERIVWISIEGLPLKVWSFNTFVKLVSKWGELVEWKNIEDNKFFRKQLCVKTKLNEIICERFKVIIQGNVHWVRAKEMEGWDPLLRFTPKETSVNEVHKKEMEAPSEEAKQNPYNSVRNNSLNASYCSQRFKAGGSITDLMDELVKVGQTMGYNMDGWLDHKTKKGWIKELCTKNRVNFVSLQETKMEHTELVTINKLWGNSSYDYAFSSSLGNSGGILCVWEPTLFLKENITSDYLLAVTGTWIPTWDGECVIMGDFNEVRSEHERYGLVFNVQSAAAFINFISLASLIDLPLDGYAYTWSAFISNRQILDGPFILNELLSWCKYKKLKAMVFKVDFEKDFDSIRWDYFDDILKSFGFRDKWRGWIIGCLKSAKGYVLVNGSPTLEFQFHRGLKQGDPFSPFLFILIMESLHLSFKKVMNAGLFTGIPLDNSLTISHLFYADDTIFVGNWDASNLKIILKVLKCFHMASGLKININKSKLMGYDVHSDEVETAARYIGCAAFVAPFSHLRVKVGGRMERINSRDDVVSKVTSWLSKWKLIMLSIEGRLTLIKSVLTSIPLYQISSFKIPIKVLNILESIRRKLFNGIEGNERKLALISWDTVLASKYGGLGVSSFFAINRALLSKWVWRFLSETSSLWTRTIKVIHGEKVNLEAHVGNGEDTLFWEDSWFDGISLKQQFPCLYSLESAKHINVAEKINHPSLSWSYRREPRGGIEEEQQNMLFSRISGVILLNMRDCWTGHLKLREIFRLLQPVTLLTIIFFQKGMFKLDG
nr:RNA-directed DNA polymerase, eukaryota [Tanacetum cinerariifolium]